MRRFVGILLLIAAAAGFAAAVQARVEDLTADTPQRISGVTDQRKRISFSVDGDGHPWSFATTVLVRCPGRRPDPVRWTPSDGAPVPFRLAGDRLVVQEVKSFDYEDGSRGVLVSTLAARVAGDRVEGRLHTVWRVSRGGRAYALCDSGYVPFTAAS